jgi:hypothetical protein
VGVICPVVGTVVHKNLFVGFDVTSGSEEKFVTYRIPFGIVAVFVQWVVGKTSRRYYPIEDGVIRINSMDCPVLVSDIEDIGRGRGERGSVNTSSIFADNGLVWYGDRRK